MQEFALSFVYGFPFPWPPPVKTELQRLHVEQARIVIEVDEIGRFNVSLTEGVTEYRALFQSLSFQSRTAEDNGELLLFRAEAFLSFQGIFSGEIKLFIVANDQIEEIKLNSDSDGNSHDISKMIAYSNIPTKARAALYDRLQIDNSKPWIKVLFLNEIKALEEHFLKQTEYDLIKASAIIRKLLVEGGAIVPRLMREYGMTVEFTANGSLHPWGRFKKQLATVHRGNTINIEQLILAYANSRGGVHLGPPEKPQQQALEKQDNSISIQGLPVGLKIFSGICDSILHALQPLVNAVVNTPDN